jgi:hypothetical protein
MRMGASKIAARIQRMYDETRNRPVSDSRIHSKIYSIDFGIRFRHLLSGDLEECEQRR